MNNKRKILIVEDNKNARETIKNSLSGLNCIFTEVDRAEKALKKIKKMSFDLIIMDIGLPGEIDGIETLYRAKELCPDLAPVIILTGFPDLRTKDEIKKLGIYAYMTKNPLSIDKLRITVIKATKLEA